MAEPQLVELEETAELSDLLSGSQDRPLVLFKHSLTCPISARAYREFQRHLSEGRAPGADYRLIVVQRARPVSDAVASQLGVRHESPQVIIVRGGQAVWDASHFEITSDRLKDALASVA